MLLVVVVVAFAVAWSLWDGTARSLEGRRRVGLLGQLAPERPAGRQHGDLPPPVSARRLRNAAIAAAGWLAAIVASAATWGDAPITYFIGLIALLYSGDLIAVLLSRRRQRWAAGSRGSPGR